MIYFGEFAMQQYIVYLSILTHLTCHAMDTQLALSQLNQSLMSLQQALGPTATPKATQAQEPIALAKSSDKSLVERLGLQSADYAQQLDKYINTLDPHDPQYDITQTLITVLVVYLRDYTTDASQENLDKLWHYLWELPTRYEGAELNELQSKALLYTLASLIDDEPAALAGMADLIIQSNLILHDSLNAEIITTAYQFAIDKLTDFDTMQLNVKKNACAELASFLGYPLLLQKQFTVALAGHNFAPEQKEVGAFGASVKKLTDELLAVISTKKLLEAFKKAQCPLPSPQTAIPTEFAEYRAKIVPDEKAAQEMVQQWQAAEKEKKTAQETE